MVNHSVTFVILDRLGSHTEYETAVAAIRDGPGGTGPRSVPVRVTTLCGGMLNIFG